MLLAENLDNKIKEFWPKNGPSTKEVEKYVKKYSKEKIVIKCGGRVLLDPVLLNSLIEDIVTSLIKFLKRSGSKRTRPPHLITIFSFEYFFTYFSIS